ncbi:YqgQ family protein [Alkalibacillus silvisoli]|uniref:YqgQ family protein n=1 Tax=Alkalibacillus silvisoli TaxID=392823 RepID=A0ABN0ZSV9_9BACI
MNSFIDVQKLLKSFGVFVYLGDRDSDILLMEEEVKELYKNNLISTDEFQKALLILRTEKKS